MSKKALNKKNLMALGTETLADLMLEVTKGNGAAQRRLRLALSAEMGAQDAARDIRKRFAAVRRATSYISRRKQKTLAKELTELVALIESSVAPDAPNDALDLYWSYLLLAPSVHDRTDDSNGTIGDAMRAAIDAIERLAPQLTKDVTTLADDVFEALQNNGYAAFDRIIPALAPALGEPGLNHLKTKAQLARAEPVTDADLARFAYITLPQERENAVRKDRDRSSSIILQDVADLQGDVDGYMAHYTPEQLKFRTIAPDVATRLLAAGRADEALGIVEAAIEHNATRMGWGRAEALDEAYLTCLEATGAKDLARAFLWHKFESELCADSLRRHLRMLPDFEDIEAEDHAKTLVLDHPVLGAALTFAVDWNDLALADRLVLSRHTELNGHDFDVLTPLAETLSPSYPMAAVLIWRALIDYALRMSRTKRYRHTAQHLKDCEQADLDIADYGTFESHEVYLDRLHDTYRGKSRFWRYVTNA